MRDFREPPCGGFQHPFALLAGRGNLRRDRRRRGLAALWRRGRPGATMMRAGLLSLRISIVRAVATWPRTRIEIPTILSHGKTSVNCGPRVLQSAPPVAPG